MATLATHGSARARILAASHWLRRRAPDERVMVLCGSLRGAAELVRDATGGVPRFGWERMTTAGLASRLALRRLADRCRSPASHLGMEVVVHRALAFLAEEGRLGRFQKVWGRPGLPGAMARTLEAIAHAGLDPTDVAAEAPDLAVVAARYALEREGVQLADRSTLMRAAIEEAEAGEHELLGCSTLFLDVPVADEVTRQLVAAVCRRATRTFAIAPGGASASLRLLAEALGAEPVPLEDDSTPEDESTATRASALARLQARLFEPSIFDSAPVDASSVSVIRASGESREAVEVVRAIRKEASKGVSFDRMAILLRTPDAYRVPLGEALRRAQVPAYFARGTQRPNRTGRALLTLLRCRREGLSASAFAEYLSLGVVPRAASPVGWAPPAESAVRTTPTLENDASLDAPASRVARDQAAPHRWERLLVDAAVLGGRERWHRRLAALQRAFEAEPAIDPEAVARRERRLAELRALSEMALPLIDLLDTLPSEGSWGDFLTVLSEIATRALHEPHSVLSVLAELAPLSHIGPVALEDVIQRVSERLRFLFDDAPGRPQGKVYVAPIDEAWGLSFEVVFVPGLAEKMFPPKTLPDPILDDDRREALARRCGVTLAVTADRIHAERDRFRFVVGAAERQLVLSYPTIDGERSRPRVPSLYLLETRRAIDGSSASFRRLQQDVSAGVESRLGWPAPEDPADAIDESEFDLATLAPLFTQEVDGVRGAARYLLSSNPHLARAVRFRARRYGVRRWTAADGLVDPTERGRSVLDTHRLDRRSFSATAVETFAVCPYRFYLRHVVSLRPLDDPSPAEELDALHRGRFVHEVQRRLLSALRDEGRLPLEARHREIASSLLVQVIDTVRAEFHENLAPVVPRTFDDAVRDLTADLSEWLDRMIDEPTWIPAHFELAFGVTPSHVHDPASQPDPVVLADGLRLRGVIDLVERQSDGSVRATDHKTGSSQPHAGTIQGGRTLQPVLYALALERFLPHAQVAGGRLFYCTARGGFAEHSVPLDDDARDAAKCVTDTVGGAIATGFLPAAPAPGTCDGCEALPLCGPHEALRTNRVKDPKRLVSLTVLRSQR